jgi:hypothetical protein
MASLKSIFKKTAKIAFKVAGDVKKEITFINTGFDNGIDEVITTSTTVYAIRENFIERDYHELSFKEMIQPTDIKLLILCQDIAEIDTNDKVLIDGKEYLIIGRDKDAADILWTVGVR